MQKSSKAENCPSSTKGLTRVLSVGDFQFALVKSKNIKSFTIALLVFLCLEKSVEMDMWKRKTAENRSDETTSSFTERFGPLRYIWYFICHKTLHAIFSNQDIWNWLTAWLKQISIFSVWLFSCTFLILLHSEWSTVFSITLFKQQL